jgi:hypothetical protein
MSRLGLPRLLEIAQQRSGTHVGHKSQRVLSKDYNLIGICGEDAFADEFGLEVDDSIKPSGDKGIDFTINLMCDHDLHPEPFTVDVKTAKLPYNLLLEVGKPVVDIYVLADYNETNSFLLGWTWGKILSKAPTRSFGYEVINHYIPAEELRPISELKERYEPHIG